ncbi:N-acetyltaurine hydrolase-like [Mytilus galloprovincialis]|uniref:N-acetyltaurine hydrolase-like n=1 Tax=Mytilus galloprovincialis TaxID=29158 RepID=UPI003F7C0E3E
MKIQTVLGPIDPSSAGLVLPHEHLSIAAGVLGVKNKDERFKDYENAAVAMDTLWWINQNPYSNIPNLQQCEEHEAVIEELKFFKKYGGGTMVDNTNLGISRDVNFLKLASEKTGVNIVAGTGYYVESSRPETVKLTVEEMATHMKRELQDGCDGSSIKCGVIGEVGCSWPLLPSEKRALQAAAQVNVDIGCPVIIHPGRDDKAPQEIVRVYQEAGGKVDKLIMSHLDRTFLSEDKLVEFAALGCYCEFDLFGIELTHYQQKESVDMPGDAIRIKSIKSLINSGYEDKITISQDIHTKHRMMKYGGHGFSHILLNIIPKMLKRGISQEQIDKITKVNPQKWLAY